MQTDTVTKAEKEEKDRKVMEFLRTIQSFSKGNAVVFEEDKVRSVTMLVTVQCSACKQLHTHEMAMGRGPGETIEFFKCAMESLHDIMKGSSPEAFKEMMDGQDSKKH